MVVQTSTVDPVEGDTDWANVISNILKIDKPKNKSSVILSRAKDLKTEKNEDEFSVEENKSLSKTATLKKDWISRGRVKPKLEEREREKKLKSIAVSGVVQLFNAVQKQQIILRKQCSDKTTAAASTQYKNLDKKSFFNILLGKEANSANQLDTTSITEVKTEPWEVLRSDFMMSAKLKDWDKQEDNMNDT